MPATRSQKVNAFLMQRSPIQIGGFALLSALLVAVLDFGTGFEVSFSILYIAPVSLAAWYGGGRTLGILVCVLAACLWLSVDLAAGHSYDQRAVVFWEAGVRFGFFLAISLLVSTLRSRLDAESRLARTDPLTGLANQRAVRDSVESVFELCRRLHLPVTVAFIDLDDFKLVNDRFGHSEGDRALVVVGSVLRGCLRRTDIVGRVGGDEFVLILPNTGVGQAEGVIRKVHERLRSAASTHGWSLGFSVGVSIHAEAPPPDIDPIQLADALVYESKHAGKNRIVFEEFRAPEGGEERPEDGRGRGARKQSPGQDASPPTDPPPYVEGSA